MVQWLRLPLPLPPAYTAGGTGSIPGRGAKIPHASHHTAKRTVRLNFCPFLPKVCKMPTVQKATMPTLACGMVWVELPGLEKGTNSLRADCCSEARQQAEARDGAARGHELDMCHQERLCGRDSGCLTINGYCQIC